MSRGRPAKSQVQVAPGPERPEPWLLRNEAAWDRLARIASGLLVLWLGWSATLPGLWGAAARIFGVVPLVTGLLGWSPLYAILGIATQRKLRTLHTPAPPAL
jgi:Inner membrane protein YgaP-like, transmembrane domain